MKRHVSIFILLFVIFGACINVEQQTAQQTIRRSPVATLYYSKECQDDINRFCPKTNKIEMSDLAVLQCIHNQVPDLNSIDQECHNLLYAVKKNLTVNLKFDNSALGICKDDIAKLTECQSVDKVNGHLTSCLLDNRENITSQGCKTFLNSIAALVFSDFRLINNFISDCQSDIQKYSCGRIEKEDENKPTQQGKTVECLSRKFNDLDSKCRLQIVRVVELQSDDFHLDRVLYFACRDDREKLCERVQSGKGRVYKCLIKNKFNSLMTKDCQEQLTRRQKIVSEDATADRNLIQACKKDILQHKCRKELRSNESDSNKLANLILCLEGAVRDGDKLEPECLEEVMEHRKQIMSDYQLNPSIVKFCSNEIDNYCNKGQERDGKTIHCLFRKAKEAKTNLKSNVKFSVECFRELRQLVKVADVSEDVRVDADLQEACENLLNNQCKNIRPGKGRVVNCLMSYLNKPEMTEECEERLLEIQFFVSRDWKLVPSLYKACKQDAISYCNAKQNWQDWSIDVDNAPLVLPCLYHHIHELEDGDKAESNEVKISPECTIEVKRLMSLRANSLDLMPEIQDHCSNDLASYCSKVNINQKGEELKCLQKNFKNLEQECKAAITKFTVEENKDVQLDKILMKSCLPTIEEFCSDIKEEKGELLECLIKQKNNPKIHEKCRAGIEHHQLLNLENVQFNYKFNKLCKNEIKEHCDKIESKVETVQCLSDIILSDTLLDKTQQVSSLCRSQLKFELFQLNENIKLDPDLYNSCLDDVQKHCSNLKSGKGQVLECLRSHLKDLSETCKNKLTKRDKINLVEQGGDYSLQTKCKNSIDQFCHVDGEEDIVSCLRRHLLKPAFELECRQVVINRIMTQNSDVRLNPSLWKACSKDVANNCNQEFTDLKNSDGTLKGRVIKCLKKNFVQDKLSKECELEVEQIMREAANVDYRLDPLLAEGCLNELEIFCSEASNDKKEDCLRVKFQKGNIDANTKCYEEVKRIIIEGAADIFVDHELSQYCANDLNKYCSDIAPGSAQQLKCLLNIKNGNKQKISVRCSEKLESRQELWNLAEVPSALNGFNDLANYINNSEHRSYFLLILFLITATVFLLGCVCRPAIFRTKRFKKDY